ncbi:MAG: hypothetical protein CM1200mP33_0620 [Chloroflexota bacterium]|nr:MAG: hypothetical protein CM1200mP33_0620 [Chloroflexota bacterium]
MILDLSPRNLERILYFAQYLVTKLNIESRDKLMELLNNEIVKLESDSVEETEETEQENDVNSTKDEV